MTQIKNDEDFYRLIQLSGLTISELADQLEYSQRTISRWINKESVPRKTVISALKNIIREKDNRSKNQNKFNFIDLFAGIGGLRIGFNEIGGKCVFTSEWDKYAKQTYLANFNDSSDHIFEGDITKLDEKRIPKHDLILAGFPCQPFSIAGVSKFNSLGKSHGFLNETQGTLFFDVARILKHHKPKAFLIENVKNLKSHDKGRTFNIIKKTLTEDLGYQITYRVIDAKSYLPQHRERIFIAGFKEKNDFDINNLVLPDIKKGPKLKSILHSGFGNKKDNDYIGSDGKVNSKYTLSDKLWTYLQDYAKKHKIKGNGFGYGLVSSNDVSRTLSARYFKDGSEILIKNGSKNPRRLTPRECSRLMGFDDFGGNNFKIPVSDTQAYKQFGNSVAVPVVKEIAKSMSKYLIKAPIENDK